ncbi:hypothetical protein M0D68_06845 [Paraburkholderia sp. SEWSISQ10-3 4]|uniref:hypothetical protein n=1 Tax=Paraburkholderia TaxID=1822464 RepID=UPI002250B322|nr:MULTISPECIES: hypothetical protein [Paraburkholderia]MCX4137894.1 hypothetical protein [Paraburkholderia aspalathi]MDN7170585.1 hypothetical protein [Paraburkholderia sp. SEWSISQ10-3 4]MDQ6500224.1 hypothetical protein [Paraburkholderia aspalathi]
MKPMPKVRGAALTARLHAMLAERGIEPPRIYPDMRAARRFHVACTAPAVTVYPSPYVIERLAHAAADAKIAVDPVYAETVERLDRALASMLDEGVGLAAPRAKSTCAPRAPHVMTNDYH